MARQRLALLVDIPRLEMSQEVGEIALKLIQLGLIPRKAASDAIRIAVASVHHMNYIVTWNFKHIANPYTRERLSAAVSDFGYRLPIMSSPEELIEFNEND